MGLCVELVLEVEGEQEEKKYYWKAQENRIMPKSEKKSDGWKEIIKKD